MKLKLNFLPYFSFIPKKLNTNSIIFKIIKVFFIAILLSNSIYLSFFENIFTQTISPFLAIWGLVLLLKSKNSKQYFWIGFFVGILWFWWIGLSSIYFNLNYLVPIIPIIIGFIYGLLFRLCYLLKFDFLRLCGIFCISFIHPLGFDWLNWGIFTVYGFFDPSYRGIICIFLIAYFIYEGYISRYSGIDLIVRQIRIAAGEILDLEQSDIKPRGFAIEARITAENVWKNFIPSPGKIGEYYPALGPSVRVDSHIYKDYTVPPYYDSMLAKLIIKATSYDLAVNKLERALKEFVIDDIRTTIPFLIAITKTREFRRGYLDTSFIETHMQELLEKTEDRHQENKEEVIAAIAATLKKIRESRE
nr:hypothetical protein [Campylobacter jejuni]